MFINKYYGFLLESILVSSNDFKSVLKSLDDPIATALEDLIGKDIETRYNNLDISDEEGKIKFVPDDKFQKGIKRDSSALIGRLVRGILTDNKMTFTDSQLEDFVNKYKASIKIKKDLDISVVEGEDLKYWYDERNHHPSGLGNSSSLANSCMRFDRCYQYFDIYAENPDTIKMVIFLEEGLLKARSLLWKTNLGWYLDRIYSSERSLENLLVEWAKEEYGDIYSFNGSSVKNMEVKIEDGYFMKYPYMDTFRYLDTEKNILSNYKPSGNNYIVLEDTHGGFSKPKMVWSNYSKEYIEEENAIWIEKYSDYFLFVDLKYSDYRGYHIPYEYSVWSKEISSYIEEDDSCEVVNAIGEKVILPTDHQDVVFDEITGEYKHIDFCVWSEIEDKYIDESSPKIVAFNTESIFNTDFGYVSLSTLKSLKSAGLAKTDQYVDSDYISEDTYLESLYKNSLYDNLVDISKRISSKELREYFLDEIEKADSILMFTKEYYNNNYDKIITIDLMKKSWKEMIMNHPNIDKFVSNSPDKEILLNPYNSISIDTPKSLINLSRKISLILEVESSDMDKIFYIAVQSMVNYISHKEKFSL